MMKKFIAMLLALVLAMSLAACGAEENPNADLVITRAPEEANEEAGIKVDTENGGEAEVTESVDVAAGPYTFIAEGVKLIPGQAFDAAKLPAPQSQVEIPSCAFQGTDNVYNYGTYEVTAYNEGEGEFIFSILFIDPNLTTPEGLALGDGVEKMEELYGTGYELNGENYVYTSGETQFSVIAQNGVVSSIEYRLAV